MRLVEPGLAAYTAAGRDPGHLGPDADAFDVTRRDKGHPPSGRGIHHRLGAPLGRLKARVALPGPCSIGSRRSNWPRHRVNWSRWSPSSPTATGPCRWV
ncbi:hypothetical protein GCM10027072_07190 [Streptomyces bullii]